MSARLATIRPLQASALLSLIGLLVAVYLWLYKIGVIGTLQCGAGACEQVQSSHYTAAGLVALVWAASLLAYRRGRIGTTPAAAVGEGRP